ncbi:MAG: adenylosuccinate synthetase [Lachnospiraceae bacterium]|nr:adenylosuccinate synthetase [Lachnospiraceae bacterium]
MITAIIGKNFGDEGKGLAVDDFCSRVPGCLVVKHNGGAQAGHTVSYCGKRFVFHQLSSGSFRGADTYFATTYYPDLYKLREEAEEFQAINNALPRIFCSLDTPLIYLDDILLNMALEESRGDARHGSCGMGINEGCVRTKAGYGLYLKDIIGGKDTGYSIENAAGKLADKLLTIRSSYLAGRRKELGLAHIPDEYEELLSSEDVLFNAAEEMVLGASLLTLVEDESEFLRSRKDILFESGQGLLLDSENKEFAPHVTASRTGLTNIVAILNKAGLSLSEVCYVSRSYVTRHGAGRLPYELSREELSESVSIGKGIGEDKTNLTNPWQGRIRYAKHGSVEDFFAPIIDDLKTIGISPSVDGNPGYPVISLLLTHLNETAGKIVFQNENMAVNDFMKEVRTRALLHKMYLSDGEEKFPEILRIKN